jgi:hypothetical protein
VFDAAGLGDYLMRRNRLLAGACAALAGAALLAWEPWRGYGDEGLVPDDPDDVILFSIDGKAMREPEEFGKPSDRELLYECPVLGRTAVTDPALRRQVVAAVRRDIGAAQGEQASCFVPRHVLRVTKGGRTVDLVICFECHNYRAYADGTHIAGGAPSVGNRSQKLLNRVLAADGVPLAP